ncbi:MAG: AMP-binding protein, partial [Clostridia bacterium]
DLFDLIKNYSINNNITINNIFLGIFNLVMSKYTYNEDVVIGIALNGRNLKQELHTVGMYVKSCPYRIKINLDEELNEYLNNVQNNLIDTIDNSVYPYDELVKDLNISRDLSRNPIFDVMYVYQNSGIPNFKFDNNNLNIEEINSNTSKFDLTFEVIPNNDNVVINLEYDTNLYNEDTINKFADCYINVIKFIKNNVMLKDIEIISSYEKELLLSEFNNTKTSLDMSKTIYNVFEDNVKINGNKKAVIFNDDYLTYNELNEKSNKLANYLLKNNVKQNDRIVVLMKKSLDYFVAILGVLKARCCYVPIECENNINTRIFNIIDEIKPKYIITDLKDNNFNNCINIEDSKNESIVYCNNDNNFDLQSYITFSSGTTGKPKAAINSHNSIIRLVKDINYLDIEKVDYVFFAGDIGFDSSILETWLALLNFKTLVIITKDVLLDVNKYIDIQNKYSNVLVTYTTPLFNKFVSLDENIFKTIKYIIVGGDVLKKKYVKLFFEKYNNINLINSYGPTECGVAVSMYNVKRSDIENDNISIGKLISNTNCLVIDKCNKILPLNINGELIVFNDALGIGYYNNDEQNNNKFKVIDFLNNRCYFTGDICSVNSNYELFFNYRKEKQIKINGYRVDTNEILNIVLNIENIKECFIEVNEDSKELDLYYTIIDKNLVIDDVKLKNILKLKLPSYMIPKNVILLDDIKLNKNGKIDILNKVKIDNKVNSNIMGISKVIYDV